MAGINKAIIVGRLGRDPELRYLQNGTPVCKLNIATSEKYTNKQHEVVENTEWHRVSVWGKMAEHVNNYLTKGSQIYIEGKLRTSSYEKEGQKHWATEIVANPNGIQFLDSKPKENSENQNSPQKQNPKTSSQKQNPKNSPPEFDGGPEPDFNDFGGNVGDDDIPF